MSVFLHHALSHVEKIIQSIAVPRRRFPGFAGGGRSGTRFAELLAKARATSDAGQDGDGLQMAQTPEFLMRAWYVAALSSEIDATALFRRRIMGRSVLIYRTEGGEAVAMHDRCPHRFAPLSMGRREGDTVVCPYHALAFDAAGHCVHNPHGRGTLPKGQVVDTFTLVERHGFVWIWMAEEAADLSLLPDFAPLDRGHANGVAHTYMKLPVNYRMILDNVMDLSHVDHVHGEVITTRGQLSPLVPQVEDSERAISARWEWEQQPPILILNQFLPRPLDPAAHYVQVNWSAPANIQLSIGAVQDGQPFVEGPSQYDLHSCTPEDEFSTHYFFATRRNHIEEDAEYNAFKIAAMHDAFLNEDGPIITACQEEMGAEDFFEMKPMLMSNDLAAVKVRRRIRDLVEREKGRGGLARGGRVNLPQRSME